MDVRHEQNMSVMSLWLLLDSLEYMFYVYGYEFRGSTNLGLTPSIACEVLGICFRRARHLIKMAFNISTRIVIYYFLMASLPHSKRNLGKAYTPR